MKPAAGNPAGARIHRIMAFYSIRISRSSRDKAALVASLRGDLARAAALRAAARSSAADRDARARLRAFQGARLARTYADLLASPRYSPAAEFFLSELYGTKERAARDETVAELVPILARMLPEGAVRALAVATRLDALSEEMDMAMVQALRADGDPDRLDATRYARAWRRCGRRADRERQIELIAEAGQALDRLTKTKGVGIALGLMRGPARAAGFGAVQEFLERGFHAFGHMGDAAEFLATLRARETAIAERLFAGEALDGV